MAVPYAEVIGDPISHSKSPLIHKFWLGKLGLDYDYRSTRVTPERLADFLEKRRLDPDWHGCSVALPHKLSAAALLNKFVAPANHLAATNCIVRTGQKEPELIGHNTDAAGFLEPLQPWLVRSDFASLAHVLGTGGAAAAASYALDRAGVTVVNYGRTWQQARDMRRRLRILDDDLAQELESLASPTVHGPASEHPECLELLINATPLGMVGLPPLRVNLDRFSPKAIVYDLVYHPVETPLLSAAMRRGMSAIDGLGMLIGQASLAFELLFAVRAPRKHDAQLRELLIK